MTGKLISSVSQDRMKRTIKFCETCEHDNLNFFQYLSDTERQDLYKHKSCATIKKGQYLFVAGETPQYLFCIYSGKVKLLNEGINDKAQIVRFATDKHLVGYRSLVANDIYRLSAVAMEDTTICMIERSYFIFLMQNHREILTDISRKIGEELGQAQQRILSLAQKNVRERTAEFLLFLKMTYGTEPDGKTLNINLSRKEIADYVGTSTEGVIRTLSEFNTDKIISIDGKKLAILNMDQLIHRANMLD